MDTSLSKNLKLGLPLYGRLVPSVTQPSLVVVLHMPKFIRLAKIGRIVVTLDRFLLSLIDIMLLIVSFYIYLLDSMVLSVLVTIV